MKELQVKILLRNATEPEWAAANPVLMQGEAAITLGGSAPKLKIGDGTSTWSQLQYLSGYVPISSVFTIEHSGEAADAYAVGQALNNKISASDLATYLSNYATTASVNTKLSSYATTASMNTALAGKAGVNDKLANPYLLVIHSGGSTYSYDGSSRVEFTVSGSGGATSYNQLTDKPQINGVALGSDSTSSSLGIIKYGTKQYWASSTYVPKNGEIIVYTDYATKTVDGTSINIPNIKIGNGSSSLTGLPFILDKVDADIISVSQSLISHINDSAVHASANEKASWNAAASASHSHDNKSVLDTLTEAKLNSWDAKSNFSGSYNDLTNKPTIPVIDSALNATSTNGVQNKVITAALNGKAPKAHSHEVSDIDSLEDILGEKITEGEADERYASLDHSHALATTTRNGFIPMEQMNFLGRVDKNYVIVDSCTFTNLSNGFFPNECATRYMPGETYTATIDEEELSGVAFAGTGDYTGYVIVTLKNSSGVSKATLYDQTKRIIFTTKADHAVVNLKGPIIVGPETDYSCGLSYGAGVGAVCIGKGNKAHSPGAVAIGHNCEATGTGSIAIGDEAKATIAYAIAMIYGIASGAGSLSAGAYTEAKGAGSTALGMRTVTHASTAGQCAVGKNNIETQDAMFIVGNGASDTDRSNAFTVTTDGTIIATKLKLGDTVWEATTSCIGYTEIS